MQVHRARRTPRRVSHQLTKRISCRVHRGKGTVNEQGIFVRVVCTLRRCVDGRPVELEYLRHFWSVRRDLRMSQGWRALMGSLRDDDAIISTERDVHNCSATAQMSQWELWRRQPRGLALLIIGIAEIATIIGVSLLAITSSCNRRFVQLLLLQTIKLPSIQYVQVAMGDPAYYYIKIATSLH